MTDHLPDRYRCAVCREPYVVPELARDCERRHARALIEEST